MGVSFFSGSIKASALCFSVLCCCMLCCWAICRLANFFSAASIFLLVANNCCSAVSTNSELSTLLLEMTDSLSDTVFSLIRACVSAAVFCTNAFALLSTGKVVFSCATAWASLLLSSFSVAVKCGADLKPCSWYAPHQTPMTSTIPNAETKPPTLTKRFFHQGITSNSSPKASYAACNTILRLTTALLLL